MWALNVNCVVCFYIHGPALFCRMHRAQSDTQRRWAGIPSLPSSLPPSALLPPLVPDWWHPASPLGRWGSNQSGSPGGAAGHRGQCSLIAPRCCCCSTCSERANPAGFTSPVCELHPQTDGRQGGHLIGGVLSQGHLGLRRMQGWMGKWKKKSDI